MRCEVRGCDRATEGRRLCITHRTRRRRGEHDWDRPIRRWSRNRNCTVPACTNRASARGLCTGHYHRLQKWGDVRADVPLRKVGQPIVSNGYVLILHKGRRQLEHPVVMEEILGRELLPGETVHHKNGKRADNRRENLELWVSAQPSGQRASDHVAHAIEMLQRYAPEMLA